MSEDEGKTVVIVRFSSNDLDARLLLETVARRAASLLYWISDYEIVQSLESTVREQE